MACVLFSSLPLIPVWRDIVSCHSSALHFDLNLQFAFNGLLRWTRKFGQVVK